MTKMQIPFRLSLGLLLAVSMPTALADANAEPFKDWAHSGTMVVLTEPEGAGLPASAREPDFPLLVPLHSDWFPFSQAQPAGTDLRFSLPDGTVLPHQIESWDPGEGTASVWVRLPVLRGDSHQEIRIHWGRPDAPDGSKVSAVFERANGFVSVWHLDDPVRDEVGTLVSRDVGTSRARGRIGGALHLAGGQGVFGGEQITNYPSGAGTHSSEAWVRAERPNVTILGWGNEGGGRGSKIRMQLRSPPHVHIDSDFSDVRGTGRFPLGEWVHVAHTYDGRVGRVYVNGRLDALAQPTLAIRSPSRLWLGGWYGHFDFVGDLDEVRISSVARSADWIRAEYENQRPLQTLVGLVVQPGDDFSLTPTELTLTEGQSGAVTVRAGGAWKIFWSEVRSGQETRVAVDRLVHRVEPRRVSGDDHFVLRCSAVGPWGVRTQEVPVTIREAIAEPVFTLKAPASWDGRSTIDVVPEIANLATLTAQGVAPASYQWTISGPAVIQEVGADRLRLVRSQGSGALKVSLALANGGVAARSSTEIQVQEPSEDPWIPRVPAADEWPEDNQFIAREARDVGRLFCRGAWPGDAEKVLLRLYAGDALVGTQTAGRTAGGRYDFETELKSGLIQYRVELAAVQAGRETVLRQATNLVCGDVYLINGQSNAVATDVGPEDPSYSSPWIRSYGSASGDPDTARWKAWGLAACRGRDDGRFQIGYWGLELGRRLVENEHVPVCILNGAVGGTRIDQHQRDAADPTNPNTIYGRLLWRVREARLTHGVRAIFWHQGENDQGADGPTGGYGWETYLEFFKSMAAGWKTDFPNVRNYYAFQIWPKSCAMGIDGSDNRLREVQRTLPRYFAHLDVMSTLGIRPPGGCHFPPAGYAEFARLIAPLVQRDQHGRKFGSVITAPDLKRARFTDATRREVDLEFDQPMAWSDVVLRHFRLSGAGRVDSGVARGNTIRLRFASPAEERGVISYVDGATWGEAEVLRGANGIAALTFCEVPVEP